MRNLIVLLIIIPNLNLAQGLNRNWLLGYNPFPNFLNGRALIDTNNFSIIDEFRKMKFQGTQATISDSAGNMLMSSNGVWIANANNDTMDNGSGLNPGYFVNSWPDGLVISYGNILLPFPDNAQKYILYHQTENDPDFPSNVLYQSIIDLTFNNGLGKVIIKNDTILQDTLSWGIAACKHSNGRDWWVIIMKDSSDIAFTLLHTPQGVDTIFAQKLNFSSWPNGNVTQAAFSKDGKKFVTATYDDIVTKNSSIIICDFNRCTGLFSNTIEIPVTAGAYLFGHCFSSTANFIYTTDAVNVFQIDTQTLIIDTVATYDGFYSPHPWCCATTFWNMYLAANGKIYITTGSSTQHLHVINNPDSAGLACDVQQHSIDLINYLHLRAVPNHPNYYLGCDTALGCGCATAYNQYTMDDSKFKIYPNPNNGVFSIGYKAIATTSKLSVIDVNGKTIHTQNLPPWSNEHSIKCLLTKGVYVVRIENGSEYLSRKMIVIDN